MIIVEKRLNDAFSQLPPIGGFKPVYKWGNEMHLLKQLKAYSDANESPYPLIYQTSINSDYYGAFSQECETRLRLIISTRNTQTELLNENRWAMSYETVLFPMVQNIVKLFKQAQIFVWNSEYSISEYPNYGNGTENFTADIWDSIVFETTIRITSNCINENINFN